MKITVEYYNNIYTAEIANDSNALDVMYEFSKLMVNCGYPPDVIRLPDGGRYICEYKEDE